MCVCYKTRTNATSVFVTLCVCVCAQSYPTLCGPLDCSLSGSSVWNFSGKNTGVGCCFFLQGIFPTQGICVSRVSCIGRQILYHWATWEAHMCIKYTKIYFIYRILLKYYILKHPGDSAMLFALKKGAKWRIPVQLGGPKYGPSHSLCRACPHSQTTIPFGVPTPSSCSRKPQWSGVGTGGVEGTGRADWVKEDTWPLKQRCIVGSGPCDSGSCQGPVFFGTNACGTATPPAESIPTEYFSMLFLVQNKCKGDGGVGSGAGWASTFCRPQIMAALSGAQLRGVEVLLLQRICRPSK